MLRFSPARADLAADWSYAGRLPLTVFPLQGLSAGATIPVVGLPVPLVRTWPSWVSCSAWVRAWRTGSWAVGVPGFWLNHSTPNGASTDCEYRLVSRWVSGPTTSPMFAPPDRSRLAPVVMLVTTLSTTVAGSPLVADVTPPGPQSYPLRRARV